jgi:competence protein ComEC
MKRPLLSVALLLIAGIIAADNIAPDWRWPAIAAGVMGIAAFSFARARRYLLVAMAVLTGMSMQTITSTILAPNDLRVLIGASPELAAIRGRLTETPYERVYERRQREFWRTLAFVDVTSISTKQWSNAPARGLVVVSTHGALPTNYYQGDAVEISGVIQLPKGPLADGLFDYRKYLRRVGIYYQFQVTSTNDWRLLEQPHAPPIADRFLNWAQGALALGLPEQDEALKLLWAMTLGWKTGLSGEVSEPFMRSGTMHIFAISGLHIAFIAALIVNLLRVFGVPRSICGVVVIPLIWTYTGITGWQASAIRSTIMTSVIVAGWALKRPSDLINSLGAAAFIILAYDPQELFQAGFQLSFLVVLSLALFTPVLTNLRDRLLAPDPFLPDQLRPRPQIWARKGISFVLAMVITSLAAWLGSMPLVAYYFHFLTPSSLIANLLVVPLSTFALVSNIATLALAGWFPVAAELFNHGAWCFMSWMIRISEWSANLPLGCFNIEAPSALTFVLYYFALVSVMAGWFWNAKLRSWCVAAVLLLSSAWIWQWQNHRSETRISIVPLQGGEAIYAQHASAPLLIDCGDESSVRSVTKPFLRARGVNRVPALLLSHGAIRQMGGIEVLRDLFRVRNIYASPLKFRSAPYRRIIAQLEEQPQLLKRISRGDKIAGWTILHPDANDKFTRSEDGAVVALGTFNGVRVLLLSDLGRAGQSALLSREPNLHADIVVAGLPHSSEPLSEPLLEALKPRAVIVTDSLYPASEHANRRLRQRLKSHDFNLWFTSDSGGVTILLKDAHWNIRPATEAPIEDSPEDQTLSPGQTDFEAE